MNTYTFPLSGRINLDCRIGFATITVEAVDDLIEASVTLSAADPESSQLADTAVEMRGPTLTVRGPKPRNGLWELPLFTGRGAPHDTVDLVARVPAGTAVRIATMGGSVTTHGRTGSVDIASGDVASELDVVDGDLRLRAGNGPLHARRVTGSAQIRSGASKVAIDQAVGSVDMGTGGGSLDLTEAGDRVRVRTGSGQATIGRARGDVDVVSGRGDVAIGLTAGQHAQLDIATHGGSFESDLPVQTSAPAGRAISIRVRSGHGRVRLFRATEKTL